MARRWPSSPRRHAHGHVHVAVAAHVDVHVFAHVDVDVIVDVNRDGDVAVIAKGRRSLALFDARLETRIVSPAFWRGFSWIEVSFL
jgi:hypothetical protein